MMLDHLDALDDATPPAPDAVLLAQVRMRADRRRQRARLTAAVACVVVLAVSAGAVAVFRNDARRAKAPSLVSEGRFPSGLRFRMTLDTPKVVLGDPVTATVAVDNDTGKTQVIRRGRSVQCALGVRALLRSPEGNSMSIGWSETCTQTTALAPGEKA
jgi:hypothetical protein